MLEHWIMHILNCLYCSIYPSQNINERQQNRPESEQTAPGCSSARLMAEECEFQRPGRESQAGEQQRTASCSLNSLIISIMTRRGADESRPATRSAEYQISEERLQVDAGGLPRPPRSLDSDWNLGGVFRGFLHLAFLKLKENFDKKSKIN